MTYHHPWCTAWGRFPHRVRLTASAEHPHRVSTPTRLVLGRVAGPLLFDPIIDRILLCSLIC